MLFDLGEICFIVIDNGTIIESEFVFTYIHIFVYMYVYKYIHMCIYKCVYVS